MISCPSCLRIFHAVPVFPVICRCGARVNAEAKVGGPIAIRNHWDPLHEYAYADKHWDPADASRFVRQWMVDIPRFTNPECGCESAWNALDHRFDCSSRVAFQRSCVDAHNLVRKKLHQPLFTYSQAKKRWCGPRVAFLASSYQLMGGTEIFHRTLIPRLRERLSVLGFAATSYVGGDGALLKVPYVTGVERAAELAARADVVITWGIDTVGQLLPRDRPQRVISVHHSDASSGWSNRLQMLDCVHEIVCVNPDVAGYLAKKTSKPIHIIPNCVDPDRIKPTVARSELRARHGIALDARVVLFGHRLSPEKQPSKAVRIAHSLPPGWVMVLAGRGELADQFVSDARVRVVGPVISLGDWLAASDVFLSLATYEGYGLSVAEAAAAGVPVVSTPTGIAPGVTQHLVAHDASERAWVSELVSAVARAKKVAPHAALCDVDGFVDAWERVIRDTASGFSRARGRKP